MSNLDVEDPMLNETKKKNQYIATICVSLGALCVGTVLSWTAPTQSQLEQEKILTSVQSGVVGAMLPLGAFVSAIPAGVLADKIGRRKSILVLFVPLLINWLLIVFSNGAVMLYVARFFAGVAAGAMCVCSPMYIGEIAEASIRGSLGSFFQMFICTGILLSYVFGSVLAWRPMSGVLTAFPFVFVGCFFFMPESPVYLVKRNLMGEAEKVLKYFRGDKYKNVEKELLEINNYVSEANARRATLKDLVASRANRRALIMGIGIMFFQQFSGINAVIFYTGKIFAGASESISPNVSSIIVGVVQLIAAYVSVMVIEKANRKFYLQLSAIGMVICLGALGMYYHLIKYEVSFAGLNALPLISVVVYIVAFSLGFGPIPWMIMSELFAPEIKGLASAIAIMTNWLCCFTVTITFNIMNDQLGPNTTFYIFAVCMVMGVFFVRYVIIETRGKSLKDIQENLSS